MKINWKKFFIINFIFIVVILMVAEICSFYSYRIRYADLLKTQSTLYDDPEEYIKENTPRYMAPKRFDYSVIEEWLKQKVFPSQEKNSKRPIVTVGCSYTEGVGLVDNQTFAAKLNKYTGRTTYNRGVGGSGIQLVYRQLTDKDFKKDIPDAEYVIYTFIYDHFFRQFQTLFCPYMAEVNFRYKLNNGHLQEINSPFWFMYWSFLVKSYLEYKKNIDIDKEISNGFPLFFATLQGSLDETKKKYPDSKFVFIEFPQEYLCSPDYEEGSFELKPEQIDKIEKMGIIYVNASELVGHRFCEKKYRVSDKDHPSEQAWDEFVPLLVKKLNL